MTRPYPRPAVPVAPVHHRADARPTPDTKETGAMPKKANPAASLADPPPEKITNRTPSPLNIKEIGGSGYFVWDRSMIDRVATVSPTFMVQGEDFTKKMAAIALRAFEPADAVEGMLAAQAGALQHASLECSRRAMLQGQPGEIASRLRRDAANSARAMVEMCEALDRRRGKGPQTIRVERVVVQDGGQAVVAGSVVGGDALPGSASCTPAVDHVSPVTSALSSALAAHAVARGGADDSLPVVPGDVRGEGECDAGSDV